MRRGAEGRLTFMTSEQSVSHVVRTGGLGAGEAEEGLSYAFRARMIGPGSRFHLHEGVLHWSVGARSGALKLSDVTQVRLTFHPGQLAAASYEMRVSGRGGERLRIGSVSRTSLTSVDDNRAGYTAFLRALHAGLQPYAARVRFEGGLAPWRWWLMSGLAAITLIGLAAVLVSALTYSQWSVTVLLLVLCPLLAWPLVETLWRNQPQPYTPSDLPIRLVPAG